MTQEKHEVECGLWAGGKLVKLRPVWGNQEAKQLSAVTFLLLNCNFTKSGLGISPAGSAPSTGVQQEHERLPAHPACAACLARGSQYSGDSRRDEGSHWLANSTPWRTLTADQMEVKFFCYCF